MASDLISRSALGIGKCDPSVFNNWAYGDGWNACIEIIENAPAVDAAPVVRCRDCEHGEPTRNARGEAVIKCHHICDLCKLPRLMEPDWFCAYGERKDGGEADE